jgi:D-threo-aldose 1-dehydrogenase
VYRSHNAGIFNTGLLVGGFTFAYGVAPPEIVEKVRRWEDLGKKIGVSLPAVAMAFAGACTDSSCSGPRAPNMLRTSPAASAAVAALPACVARVVIGCSKAEEVEANVAFLEESARVPGSLFAEAKAMGLLPEHIPVP